MITEYRISGIGSSQGLPGLGQSRVHGPVFGIKVQGGVSEIRLQHCAVNGDLSNLKL